MHWPQAAPKPCRYRQTVGTDSCGVLERGSVRGALYHEVHLTRTGSKVPPMLAGSSDKVGFKCNGCGLDSTPTEEHLFHRDIGRVILAEPDLPRGGVRPKLE